MDEVKLAKEKWARFKKTFIAVVAETHQQYWEEVYKETSW
jgi:hypothetical protein